MRAAIGTEMPSGRRLLRGPSILLGRLKRAETSRQPGSYSASPWRQGWAARAPRKVTCSLHMTCCRAPAADSARGGCLGDRQRAVGGQIVNSWRYCYQIERQWWAAGLPTFTLRRRGGRVFLVPGTQFMKWRETKIEERWRQNGNETRTGTYESKRQPCHACCRVTAGSCFTIRPPPLSTLLLPFLGWSARVSSRWRSLYPGFRRLSTLADSSQVRDRAGATHHALTSREKCKQRGSRKRPLQARQPRPNCRRCKSAASPRQALIPPAHHLSCICRAFIAAGGPRGSQLSP